MKHDMKAMYLTPNTEVIKVQSITTLMIISGPSGLKDGGQATDNTIEPQ